MYLPQKYDYIRESDGRRITGATRRTLWDRYYLCAPKSEVERFLKADVTNQRKYIGDTPPEEGTQGTYDCNSFAVSKVVEL